MLNFSNIHDPLHISFSYLAPRTMLRCAEVCKKWRSIIKNPCLWKEILHRTFGLRDDQINEIPNQIEFYKKHWSVRNNLKLGQFKSDTYNIDLYMGNFYFDKNYAVSVPNSQDCVEILNFQTRTSEKIQHESGQGLYPDYLHHGVIITGKPLVIYHIDLKKKIILEGQLILFDKDFFAVRDENHCYTLFDVKNFKSLPLNIEKDMFKLDLKNNNLIAFKNTKLLCYSFPSLKLKYTLENRIFENVTCLKEKLIVNSGTCDDKTLFPMMIYDRNTGILLHDFAQIPPHEGAIPGQFLKEKISTCTHFLAKCEKDPLLLNKTASEFLKIFAYLCRDSKEGLAEFLYFLYKKNHFWETLQLIFNSLYVKKISSRSDNNQLFLIYTDENFEIIDLEEKKSIMNVDTRKYLPPKHSLEYIMFQDRIIAARRVNKGSYDKIYIWEISTQKFIKEISIGVSYNIHLDEQLLFVYKSGELTFFDPGNGDEIAIPQTWERRTLSYRNGKIFHKNDYDHGILIVHDYNENSIESLK